MFENSTLSSGSIRAASAEPVRLTGVSGIYDQLSTLAAELRESRNVLQDQNYMLFGPPIDVDQFSKVNENPQASVTDMISELFTIAAGIRHQINRLTK